MKVRLAEDEAWPVLHEYDLGDEYEIPDDLYRYWKRLDAEYWRVHQVLLEMTTRKYDTRKGAFS